MTSKNLSFKLMAEDAKRRIWMISLLALSFFFGVIMPMMFLISESVENFASAAEMAVYVQKTARRILNCEDGLVSMILVIASVVCSVSGFSYLYSSKKTDLYHSIPVKRQELFLAQFSNGILMTGICFLAAQVLAAVLASTAGVPFGEGLGLALRAWCFHMAFFCLLYATMTAAVMMTGNLVISLLGGLVFNFYIPGVAALFGGYVQMFFHTYHYTGEEFWNVLIEHGSPFIRYLYETDQLSREGNDWIAAAVIALVVSAVLAVISWWLYEKRPSEAAGKAMAFRISQAPIRILLVIPISLSGGMFFVSLRDTLGWGIFGLICGAVLTHCLMEIIYHFDFRKLFAKKLHLVICVAASLLIFCGFRFDWFGYDSYLPPADKVEYASVNLGGPDDWVTYGKVEKNEHRDGSIEFWWSYEDELDFAAEHMKITDLEPVLALAEIGIQNKEYGGYFYQVQYHLKNGRVVNRDYYIPTDRISYAAGGEEEMARIFDMPEYKQGVYPLLYQTPEETERVIFQQYNQMQEVIVDEAGKSELLKTYQEELLALTSETAKRELPIGTIQFMNREMEEVLYDYRETVPEWEFNNTVYNVENRCYYPVYLSFHKTLELLKKAGVEVSIQSTETVDQIQVEIFPKDSVNSTSSTKIYTDPEQIEELIPALIPDDYYGMNPFYEAEILAYTDAYVWVKDADGRKQIHCELDASKIPDFLK